MNMYEAMFSPSSLLNEKVARQIFDVLGDNGPVMLIIDREGHQWPSDSDAFIKLNICQSYLDEICAQIDDGVEPVITQTTDCMVAASELATDRTKCGYILVFVQADKQQQNLVNHDLLEIMINQVNLIARLIEKNSLLYELQVKQQSGVSMNNFSKPALN